MIICTVECVCVCVCVGWGGRCGGEAVCCRSSVVCFSRFSFAGSLAAAASLLLKTSRGISSRCHGPDTTSHTHTLAARVFMCATQSQMIRRERYLSLKRAVTVKRYTRTIVCFTSPIHFGSGRRKVDFWAHANRRGPIIASLCSRSGTMCFSVACGVVVSKWWLRERESAWCACHFVSVAHPLTAYLLLSALSLSVPVCLSLSVCLSGLLSLSLSIWCRLAFIKLTPSLAPASPRPRAVLPFAQSFLRSDGETMCASCVALCSVEKTDWEEEI